MEIIIILINFNKIKIEKIENFLGIFHINLF